MSRLPRNTCPGNFFINQRLYQKKPVIDFKTMAVERVFSKVLLFSAILQTTAFEISEIY